MKLISMITILCVAGTFVPAVRAIEEKNGFQISVEKKTLDRNDRRYIYSGTTYKQRIETFRVTIKNASMKPMPAGELRWTILDPDSSYSSGILGSRGVAPLKDLKPSESVQLEIGEYETGGSISLSGSRKDKAEYQFIIMHGSTEAHRMASTPAFDALAKRADFRSRPNP